MKQHIKYCMIGMIFFSIMPMSFANQFVVTKKIKEKKESVAQIKEDIVEILELTLRQLGQNIQQLVHAQNQIFDTIKNMCTDNQQSITQLKATRDILQKNLIIFEQQQVEIKNFLKVCA